MKSLSKCLSISLFLIASLFSLSVKAQFSRGTVMLGTTVGTTGYSSANSTYDYDAGELRKTGTNTFTFSGGPQVGVFLSNNFVIGATPSIAFTSSNVKTTTDNTNNTVSGSSTTTNTFTISLGPFMRYYFAGIPGNNWFYFQANGSVGTGTGSNSGNSYTSTTTATTNGKESNVFTWNAGGSIGLTHLFFQHVGLDFALGYTYTHNHNYNIANTNTTNKTSGDLTSTSANYTLGTGTSGVTASVGYHWYLQCKKHTAEKN